jgi:hypothetical protein
MRRVAPLLPVTEGEREYSTEKGHKRLHDERAAYAAVILHQYVEQLKGTRTDARRCFIVDVRKGAVFTAAAAFKKRRREIAAALRGIFGMWPSVPVKQGPPSQQEA